MLRRLNHRRRRRDVVGNPNLGASLRRSPDRLHRHAMSQHNIMVQLCQALLVQLQARRMGPHLVTQLYKAAYLVHRHKVLYAVRKFPRRVARIIRKRLRRIAILPAPRIFQTLRQIPVIERAVRLNPSREQRIHHPVIEVEPSLIRLPFPTRKNSRPCHREAKRLQPHLLHHRDVLRVAIVEVIRNVARIAISRLSARMRERVPD